MFSLSTGPAKQSVGETITVLSGRLNSAVLLEDRRAAILGLRSFAKDYPASVASGALRSLIGSLSNDGDDVDTVKLALETLLMLFNPNEESPEASEEIALWLADEFTQRQENITLLLALLETTDFHCRLYTLQVLTAILSNRTERTEECVFTAPLGVSRLVGVLDDSRDAIRNEAISLLIYLTPSSGEIQKLVAFENAFERLFSIIDVEGSVSEGGRVVEDCFILLANLLRRNTSNQSLFRETSGCVAQLVGYIEQACNVIADETELAVWARTQRTRNVFALLAVVRLFLVPGSVGTPQNQAAFWRQGLLYHTLHLAFFPGADEQIRAEALATCGDVIRGDQELQGGFAQLQVESPLTEGVAIMNGEPDQAIGVAKVYVIDGLLDLILAIHSPLKFNTRLAACECLKAYFYNHRDIRLHFLARAIDGHKSHLDETANILTALLQPSTRTPTSDPYRVWFAAVIAFHLLFDNTDAKASAMSITEGDADSGEEVVTCIQAIAGQLVTALGRGDDPRIPIAYLMLLLGWLYEDPDAVNDFLGEGSHVQSLIRAIVDPLRPNDLVQGLCALLLGLIYDFSTKDSAIPRTALHGLLTSGLGRDRYVDKLTKLRGHHFVRDFEILPQKADISNPTKLPDVYFDAAFVEFLKDTYSSAVRAIDRDPGVEIPVLSNGVHRGISRELVDTLQSKLEETQEALESSRVFLASVQSQLEREKAEHRRTREKMIGDVTRIEAEYEALKRRHKEEVCQLEGELQRKEVGHTAELEQQRKRNEELRRLLTTHQSAEHDARIQLVQIRCHAEAEAERLRRRSEAEMADLRATISRLQVDILKTSKNSAQEAEVLRKELAASEAARLEAKESAAVRLKDLESRLSEACEKLRSSHLSLKEAIAAKNVTQSELDDLLMVFGDMEEKISRYKKRLADKGEEVSDDDGVFIARDKDDSDEDN